MPIYEVALTNGKKARFDVPADIQGREEIARYIEQNYDLTKPPETGTVTGALKGQYYQSKADAARLLGRLGVVDIPAAEKYAEESEKEKRQVFTPTTEGWGTAPWSKFKEALGGSAVQTAVPVAAGLAALAAPAYAVPLTAAGLGTSALMYTGSGLSRQVEEGTKLEETNLPRAAVSGAGSALLDRVGMGLTPGIRKLIASTGVEISEAQARAIANRELGAAARDYAKSTGKAMTAEGATEVGQQVLERWQAGLDLTDPQARAEYIESLIGGAVVGGALSVPGRAIERSGIRAKVKAEDRDKESKVRDEQMAAATAASEQDQQRLSAYTSFLEGLDKKGLIVQRQQLRRAIAQGDAAQAPYLDAVQDALATYGQRTSAARKVKAAQPEAPEAAPAEAPEAAPAEAPEAVTEAAPAAEVPPGAYTQDEVLELVRAKRGTSYIPWFNENVVGKTPEEVQALIQADPTLVEGNSGRAKVLRSLRMPGPAPFEETADVSGASAAEQPTGPEPGGGEPSVGVSGPTVESGRLRPAVPAAEPVAPARGGVAGAGPDVEAGAAPAPTVPPPLEETRGPETPEAVQAQPQPAAQPEAPAAAPTPAAAKGTREPLEAAPAEGEVAPDIEAKFAELSAQFQSLLQQQDALRTSKGRAPAGNSASRAKWDALEAQKMDIMRQGADLIRTPAPEAAAPEAETPTPTPEVAAAPAPAPAMDLATPTPELNPPPTAAAPTPPSPPPAPPPAAAAPTPPGQPPAPPPAAAAPTPPGRRRAPPAQPPTGGVPPTPPQPPAGGVPPAPGPGGLQGNRFTLAGRTLRERISNLFANEMSRVADVQRQVVEQGGVMSEETNIENALHRMYGRAGSRIDAFRKNVLKPLINDAANAGVSLDDVMLYVYARHAPSRNKYIRTINPSIIDGSGMTDADAAASLQRLRSQPNFAQIQAIGNRFQAITRMTGDALVDGGLVSAAMRRQWDARYQHYVPLKSFEQVDANGTTGNPRFDPRDPFFRRAMGRESRAGQVLENIIRDYEEAVVAAEKNKLRQSFYKFVKQNPDSRLWQIDPLVVQRRFDKTQNLVEYAIVPDDSNKRTVGVRINGVEHSIRVNDPAMLSDLQMQTFLSNWPPAVKQLFQAWAGINRTLGRLWTALSPAFVLTNAMRDLQTALVASGIEGGRTRMVSVARDFMPMAYTIMRAERSNNWSGNPDLKAYFDMYRADGGKTGFLDLKDMESRQKQLISDFRNAQASPKDPRSYHRLAMRYIQSADDFIMDINSGIENAARVAAYKSVIEGAGYNYTNAPASVRNEAATVAKNLTVNFNRRGKLTPLLSSFYLFFNPAVQGALRTGKLVMSPRGAAVAGSLAAIGYIAASMADGATGEDGEPFWDKEANNKTKLRNLVFFGPNGEQYTVPLPYGLGFFVNLGYALHDLNKGADVLKTASFMKDAFFTHFSPLGAMDNMANFLAPTLLDPVITLSSEKRDSGIPLLPTDYTGDTPDAQRYWTSTRGTLLQKFTSWLDEETKGGISISPERLAFIGSFATGGAGSFVKDMLKSIDLTMNVGPDAALDENAYPILKQFYKRDTGRADQQAFFDNAKTVKQAAAVMDRIANDTAPEYELARIDINDTYAALETLQRRAQKQLAALRKEEIEIIDDPTLTPAEKYARRKVIDADRREVEQEFNREFYSAKRYAETLR